MQMDEYFGEDQISQLDDQVLITILSLLTVKEAERTCVLSKRWRYLWTFTSCLNFEALQRHCLTFHLLLISVKWEALGT